MKILFINPVLRTAETRRIPPVDSICDSLAYNICLAFASEGHEIELMAASEYRPKTNEAYPFKVSFFNSAIKWLFSPRVIPFMPSSIGFLIRNSKKYDLIISSEVHTFHTLIAALIAPKKLIIWHELSFHYKHFNQAISKAYFLFSKPIINRVKKIAPRSNRAKTFLQGYFSNVIDDPIGHGLDIEKFQPCEMPEDYFIVCSQLIARKRVDNTIIQFGRYLTEYPNAKENLFIFGDGNQAPKLQDLCGSLGLQNKVLFFGHQPHKDVLPYLSKAKALLISSQKDLTLLSVAESIACATPVITHSGVDTSDVIHKLELGFTKDDWGPNELKSISDQNGMFRKNCMKARGKFSNKYIVSRFIELAEASITGNNL